MEFDQPISSQKTLQKMQQKRENAKLKKEANGDFYSSDVDDDFGFKTTKTQGAKIIDSSSEDDSEDEAEFERQLLARREAKMLEQNKSEDTNMNKLDNKPKNKPENYPENN